MEAQIRPWHPHSEASQRLATDPWEHLPVRKHRDQAAMAQVNRNVRIAWALLAGNRAYRSPVAATGMSVSNCSRRS
ncbi:hypothetical protein [Paraburkholderia sartisoli]|uniref:hypothetical protein n=1 Tax=Paraburkholderia sartisoli TaxID=83784 RepID=UPI001160E0E3|nr:hypothetical protein [Paraburkholderia sartisoli]